MVAGNATGVAGQTDAYLRSLDANTTEMVSVTSTGAEGGGVRSGRKASRAGLDRIDPHRPGDVLEFLVAKIFRQDHAQK